MSIDQNHVVTTESMGLHTGQHLRIDEDMLDSARVVRFDGDYGTPLLEYLADQVAQRLTVPTLTTTRIQY